MVRMFRAGAVVVTLLWLGALPAAAQPAAITVQTSPITLTVADPGKGTGTLTTTNLTDAPVTIQLAIENPAGCRISPTQELIPAAIQHDTAVTVTGCGLHAGSAVDVKVTPGTGNAITIQATVDAQPSPRWSIMSRSFFFALVGALVICVGVLVWAGRKGLAGKSLQGLGKDYDLSKSWATTATLISTAFAGLFGSTDVLKKLLGKDDADLTTLVGVSAALALAFVTAGPLVLGALKNKEGQVTVPGLLAGALLTLAGTGGQVLVLFQVGHQLDLGTFAGIKTNTIVLWLGFLGTALLAWYAWRSLRTAIEQGVKPLEKSTTTITSQRPKSRREVAKQVDRLREISPDALEDAIDQLHEEETAQQYEIALAEPSRPRPAIL
ncbi:hypothetical protein [Jatrophihabitans sp.]|uniref:hypothetical protein n=1 Tax=Jatrophihabitans sp. TaxID=1932789 RepID=UPI002CA02189|nr:hypothetical protein [Jatrophihabitans sp.]